MRAAIEVGDDCERALPFVPGPCGDDLVAAADEEPRRDESVQRGGGRRSRKMRWSRTALAQPHRRSVTSAGRVAAEVFSKRPSSRYSLLAPSGAPGIGRLCHTTRRPTCPASADFSPIRRCWFLMAGATASMQTSALTFGVAGRRIGDHRAGRSVRPALSAHGSSPTLTDSASGSSPSRGLGSPRDVPCFCSFTLRRPSSRFPAHAPYQHDCGVWVRQAVRGRRPGRCLATGGVDRANGAAVSASLPQPWHDRSPGRR